LLLTVTRMRSQSLRAILALLVLVGFLSVTMAAVSPGHLHNAQKPDSCALCQVSFTPFTTAPSVPAIWPPVLSGRNHAPEQSPVYAGRQVTSDSSRAPPQA
jgi:hypothetical protein